MGDHQEDKYDCWGLSLSLKPPVTHVDHHHKPICKREPSTEEQNVSKMQKTNSSGTLMIMQRIMGMEVKPRPLVIDLEEVETTKFVSSPNSTISSASGKRFCGFSGERDLISDEEDGGGGSGGGGGGSSGGGSGGERGERKKLRLSKEQIMVLEQAFKEHTTLNTKQKVALAKQVNLRPRQVEVWFQNRRARTKLKQTEVDCEYLRRFCETLTEENRKLQKEVQELRALKVSPEQSFMHAKHPPTTLTMCPSCKNVSISSSSSVSAKAPTGETPRYPVGVFHQQVPLSLKKLSLTINSNRLFESHLPRA